MKSILISIKPKYVKDILNRIKTIEIRKTRPNIELPCKVYIYCTKGKKLYKCVSTFDEDLLNGKVVAEFTLNKVEKFDIPYPAYFNEVKDKLKHITDGSCLTLNDLHRYLKNKNGYAWFIEDLKIYDKPKELSEFSIGKAKIDCGYGNYNIYNKILKRPPQSWCYIEGDN